MPVRTKAAPPTPWSKDLAEPTIDETAYVHSFSKLIGDVKVGANVLIAPGSSIRADEGTPFHIGEDTNIQDGVVIHGLEKGRVIGDDGKEYSVWIGKETCITHMALIHGPAYVGDQCFIGFRSTVFNARVGNGCIVMMHSLIQDVEIPPGKYVPSGAVITNQQQADRLPNVNDEDKAFAHHVVQINEALLAGYRCADQASCINPIRDESIQARNHTVTVNGYKSGENMSLNPEIVQQVRSILAQGNTIGAEHASSRRFKTKSWLSCGLISGTRADQVLLAVEKILAEYPGEYVRLIGIDPGAKRRVAEIIVQRPGDAAVVSSGTRATSSYQASSPQVAVSSNGGILPNLAQQVRSLLSQGLQISTEHASSRRFKTKSWLTGGIIDSRSESEVLRQIEATLAENAGEYVRLIGADPGAKRRVVQTIIQRPGSSPVTNNGSTTASYTASHGTVASNYSSSLDAEAIAQVRSLLAQGYKIGTEHADQRRFKTKSWQSCSPIDSTREADVIAALEACIRDHQGEYVRLLGIDPKAKRRVLEAIIQRPNGQNGNGRSVASTTTYTPSNTSVNNGGASVGSSVLGAETLQQVRSLLAQGYKIGSEHADKRRFKTKSWQSCAPIESNRENDVVAALEACIREHQGEYVRLLGIDASAKRRVLETIIQRP